MVKNSFLKINNLNTIYFNLLHLIRCKSTKKAQDENKKIDVKPRFYQFTCVVQKAKLFLSVSVTETLSYW
jgi:hypothetical protein